VIWLVSAWLLHPTALAGEEPVLTQESRDAEYRRLRDDLRKYARKQIWPAVERSYTRCMELYPDPETGRDEAWAPPTPMEQMDHMQGAHAASSRGDLYEVRKRVVRAVRKEQTAEALDWLWAIDTTYSEVVIQATPGTKLVAVRRPFDPVIARSIDFAASTLDETGSFHGLLPRLPYTVGAEALQVSGGMGVVSLDLTNGKKPKKAKKKKSKKR
jgi:hypothetical protein